MRTRVLPLLLGLCLLCGPLVAAVITVDATCSLADAISSANSDSSFGGCGAGSGPDEIVLTQDVLLTSALPTISSEIQISGGGFVIERGLGTSMFRLLHVDPFVTFSLDSATLRGGVARAFSGGGGGLLIEGHATLTNTIISNNLSLCDNGGGIRVDFVGSVTLIDSLVEHNTSTNEGCSTAPFGGGGIAVRGSAAAHLIRTTVAANQAFSSGGGIHSHGVLVLENSTVSGNASIRVSGTHHGGGLFSIGDTTLTNTTVTGNEAIGGHGGGVSDAFDFDSEFIVSNTVISGNVADFNRNCVATGVTDLGGNFSDGDFSCPSSFGLMTGLDPVLADNRGPTPTHALERGSSAIDAGVDCLLDVDQRGFPRDSTCDSGAFEYEAGPFSLAIVGECPGMLTVTISRATPDSVVELFEGEGGGASVVPDGSCAGTALDLVAPQSVASVATDGDGSAVSDLSFQAGECGFQLQGVDEADCSTSLPRTIDSCDFLTTGHTGSGADPVASSQGSPDCAFNEFVPGDVVTLVAAPGEGFRVDGWSGTDDDSSTDETNTVVMPSAEHLVEVHYSSVPPEECHFLTRSHTGGGDNPQASPLSSPGCPTLEYSVGEVITLTADPDAQSIVSGWTGTDDDSSVDLVNTVTMPDAAHEVTVHYDQVCFSMDLERKGQGTIPRTSPKNSPGCLNGSYLEGVTVALSDANPSAGWSVARWFGTENDNSTASTNSVVTPAENFRVGVLYERVCFYLKPLKKGSGADLVAVPTSSTGCPDSSYLPGEVIDLTANPDSDSQVRRWRGTDDDSSSSLTNTVTMPANSHFVAVQYEDLCNVLTLDHSGSGANPTAAPLPDGSAWAQQTVTDSFAGVWSAVTADVDGDGDPDVLSAASGADAVSWWENVGGDGSSWIEHAIGTGFDHARMALPGDLDGDGDIDVVGAAWASHEAVTWWENTAGDGTSWNEHAIDFPFTGAVSLDVADIDGDTHLDVLGAAQSLEELAWWRNSAGDGSAWTKHTVASSFDQATSVFAADMDGDGDLDVLGAANFDNDIAWWENTLGDGTVWLRHDVTGLFLRVEAVVAADLDGDGDMDVLGAAEAANSLTWWENTSGDGLVWSEHPITESFLEARSVVAADLDGDGDLDVLGAAGEAARVTWWENSFGDGTAWVEHPIGASLDGAWSVHAADIDGDPGLDVLAAVISAGDILSWKNLYTGSCSPGSFNPGDRIVLTAAPDPGWEVGGWEGSDDDTSTETTNLVTMPAADHAVNVLYVESAATVGGSSPD